MTRLREVPTCTLDTELRELSPRLGDHGFALVVNDARVVLGKVLDRSVAAGEPGDLARDHLIEGPTTVRADEDVADLHERMERADTTSVIVTTAEGQLLGAFFRDEDA